MAARCSRGARRGHTVKSLSPLHLAVTTGNTLISSARLRLSQQAGEGDTALKEAEHQPVVFSGFPDGTRVVVTGGRYDGDHGTVVNRAPDLRPGSVWVELVSAGTHLVPADRLAHRNHSDEPTIT